MPEAPGTPRAAEDLDASRLRRGLVGYRPAAVRRLLAEAAARAQALQAQRAEKLRRWRAREAATRARAAACREAIAAERERVRIAEAALADCEAGTWREAEDASRRLEAEEAQLLEAVDRARGVLYGRLGLLQASITGLLAPTSARGGRLDPEGPLETAVAAPLPTGPVAPTPTRAAACREVIAAERERVRIAEAALADYEAGVWREAEEACRRFEAEEAQLLESMDRARAVVDRRLGLLQASLNGLLAPLNARAGRLDPQGPLETAVVAPAPTGPGAATPAAGQQGSPPPQRRDA